MKITVMIDSIDGENCFSLQTMSPTRALKFWEKYNHEGANVVIKFEYHDEEKGHEVLFKLAENER